MMDSSDDFKFCNHHHQISDKHEMVDFGDGKFVANKASIPLLKALNDAGLRTRTHHFEGSGNGFFSILIDDHVQIEINTVNEIHAGRTTYNGQKELLVKWVKK